MSYLAPSTSSLRSTEIIDQEAMSGESQRQRYASFTCYTYCLTWIGNSPHTASIHILDDDSLLNVFYLYRPFLLGEDHDDNSRLIGGERQWVGERWWYKLAHVCRRWRNVALGSPFHLGLCLVCTFGTPVADMLAHSPPLPLIIDYSYADWDITAEEEERIVFALE